MVTAFLAALLCFGLPATAAERKDTGDTTRTADYRFEYAAKIVCGIQSDRHGLALARGVYATTVNIRNPNRNKVELEKSLALTFPPDEQKPGEVLPISVDHLGPGEALAADCVDVKVRLFPYGFPRSFIEGFVVVRSTHSLDVTAVYTAAGLEKDTCCDDQCCEDRCCGAKAGQPPSIDVERIPERSIRLRDEDKRPDLVPAPPFPAGDRIGEPGTGYCVEPASGRFAQEIRVLVRNVGDGDAGPSSTGVTFEPGGAVAHATPALAPGAETALDFAIPTQCIAAGACKFEIAADEGKAVEESLETNNTAVSVCRTRRAVQ